MAMEYFPRWGASRLQDLFAEFPSVTLLGARQVGKSTLVEHEYPGLRSFVFEPYDDPFEVRERPGFFLEQFPPPLLLDEVQYVPQLLAKLKVFIDRNRQPGQYILTGSQNLMLQKNLAESMVGRTVTMMLYGLAHAEAAGVAVENTWPQQLIHAPRNLSQGHLVKGVCPLTEWMIRGALPEAHTRSMSGAIALQQDYLQRYLERDVRFAGDIRNLEEYHAFLRLSATLTGQEINLAQFGRELGLHAPTVKSWLSLLEQTYQVVLIPPLSRNAVKRLSERPKLHWLDSGLACRLLRIASPETLMIWPNIGSLFESFVVSEVVRCFAYDPVPPVCWHWRVHGGPEVDLILERDGLFFPIEVKFAVRVRREDIRGIQAFREAHPELRHGFGAIVYSGEHVLFLEEDIVAIPWNWALHKLPSTTL